MPAELTYNTQLSQSEIISKSAAHLKAVGYKVKAKKLIVKAKNGRDYTTWVAVVLFLFAFIPFLIYLREAEKLGNMFQG